MSFLLPRRYGLFRRMTGVGDGGQGSRVSRPEVELQGSMDGEVWLPYVFKYKPGPVSRRPPWVAPHQPRYSVGKVSVQPCDQNRPEGVGGREAERGRAGGQG